MTNTEQVGKLVGGLGRGKFRPRLGFYKPQEQRSASVSFRCPEALKEDVKKLAKFWTALERIQSGNKDAKVSEADVWVRLAEVGIEGAWAEVGGSPADDAEMKALVSKAAQLLPRK